MFSESERDDMRAANAAAKTPQGRYGLGKRIEYRVKPVTRFIVTKWEKDVEPEEMGSAGHAATVAAGGAEYDSYDTAFAVAYALCKADHDWLGYHPDDERVQYPKMTTEAVSRVE